MKKTLVFLFAVISCLLVGLVVARWQAEAFASWYSLVTQSILMPPDNLFTAVWLILYFFMGLSIGYIMTRNNPKEQLFIRLFTIQIVLSVCWNAGFFYFKSPVAGLILIVLLAIAVFWYLFKTYYRANRFSFLLFIPYFLWTLFCGYLNLCVVMFGG